MRIKIFLLNRLKAVKILYKIFKKALKRYSKNNKRAGSFQSYSVYF